METSAGGSSGSAIGAADQSAAVSPIAQDPNTSSGTQKIPPPKAADPEWEFSDGKKRPRAEVEKRLLDIQKGAQMADQRAKQTSAQYQQLTQMLTGLGISMQEFHNDPQGVFDRVAHEHVSRRVDESMMDPRDLELKRLKAERENWTKSQEEQRQREEHTQRERAATHQANEYAAAWAPALKESGLPANPKTVARMADVMRAALKQRVQLSPQEAAGYVRQQLQQEQTWHLDQYANPEELAQALGPKRLEMLRQHLLNQVRKPSQPRTQGAAPPREAATGKYLGWGDYAKTRRI